MRVASCKWCQFICTRQRERKRDLRHVGLPDLHRHRKVIEPLSQSRNRGRIVQKPGQATKERRGCDHGAAGRQPTVDGKRVGVQRVAGRSHVLDVQRVREDAREGLGKLRKLWQSIWKDRSAGALKTKGPLGVSWTYAAHERSCRPARACHRRRSG